MVKRLLLLSVILLTGVLLTIPAFNYNVINAAGAFTGTTLNAAFWSSGLQHMGIELIAGSGTLLILFLINSKASIFYASIAVTIALFFIFLFQYAVNIPITDDYITILTFSNNYFSTYDPFQKLSLLFSFHGECRLVMTRVAIIIMHFITGEVNIKVLVIISNICLPLILFLLNKQIKNEALLLPLLLIIALLLFQYGYYDAIVWATDAFHYQLTILLVLLALHLLEKNSAMSKASCAVCSVLAMLTFGNGLLIFPITLLYFVILKNYKMFFAWLLLTMLACALYLSNFGHLNQQSAHFSLADYFIYSCCFIGGAFQFAYSLYLPFACGLVVWILFAVLTITGYYKKSFFHYAILLFTILSSLLAAHFRSGNGYAGAISNRYGIFSVLSVSASLIAFFEIINEKQQPRLIPFSIAVVLIYHLMSGLFFFPEVPVRKQKLEAFINGIKHNKPFKPVLPVIPEGADDIVKEAMKKKIYFP